MRSLKNLLGLLICIGITMVIGIYIGGQLAQAQTFDVKWYPRFRDTVLSGEIKAQNPDSDSLAFGVTTKWMEYQVTESKRHGNVWMYIIVKEKDTEKRKGKILDPADYELYIAGYNINDIEDKISYCEDFPPIQWP